MDTLGALALATEPPTDHLMDRSPVGRRSEFYFLYYCSVLWIVLFLGNTALEIRRSDSI